MVVRDVDRYGRTVGEVILPDGRNLNQELVRAGLAWWYVRFAPRDRVLASLQAEASEAKRGLWTDKNPVRPWEWRRARTNSPGRQIGQAASPLTQVGQPSKNGGLHVRRHRCRLVCTALNARAGNVGGREEHVAHSVVRTVCYERGESERRGVDAD